MYCRSTRTFVVIALACAPLSVASAQPAKTVLDARTRQSVLDSVVKIIANIYIFPTVADSVVRTIRARAAHGAYDVATAEKFAALLTTDLRALSADRHLALHYEPKSFRETKLDSAERARRLSDIIRELDATNWGLPEVRVMEHNVGYLALTSTLSPARAGDLFANAMTFLARTDALILDLRANTGGDAEMATLVLSYFFDEPVKFAEARFRDPARVTQSWTYAFVPGKSYRSKRPVYVLMSDSTFSAAEAIAYALQANGRATIVGVRTRGGANSGDFYSVGSDLELFVPNARVVSPITKTNWEGVGVRPDIPTSADDALRVAHDSAVARLRSARK